MKSILKRLNQEKVLVSDGAWGTFLHKRGLQPGECPELWNVTQRNDVLAIAKSYIDAGADMILTNSFGGSPVKLAHYGLKDRASELNQAAAEISRQAAGDDHYVLGNIGPTGVMLMMGQVSEQEMYDGFSIQAEALKLGGADAICIETMAALDEGILAVRAAKENTDLEVICSFTFEKTIQGDYKSMMGVSPSEMIKAIKDAGADIIGTNCGNGFDQMIPIVEEMRKADAAIPILVHANAGIPLIEEGETIFPETPEMMASKVYELINCGANIIGGCCGTTPDHIRALVKEIKKL
ncbi:MAG: homocysteine S-methyltransferase family protein [Calditrichaceae bacterium]|nr:homocysteine S-methyltransferase family protein [Calditrichaceae bacterium]